ncbi:MAG TPA: aminoglycoside phosphotransferase [Jatrophihabitantaceae bacterium]|nr:aminoglycoside phosphotransferase [Jatrophihabitantaceae bacterium]
MTLSEHDLQPLVIQWLPAQRWFAGKGRPSNAVALRRLEVLEAGPPELSIWLATVSYDDGGTESYQLPLVLRPELVPTLEHVLLGSVTIDDQPHWIYDALHDKDVTQAWLLGIRDEATLGPLRFARVGDPDTIPVGQTSLVTTAEQSNTSLIYGDQAILKVFRRLEPGINPDIEVHRALTELGARHIARLLGTVTADIDGQPTSLAMLQEFMTTATDGWELAKTSVRDLMAEADLHAEEAGGDFAGEAERLGVATAEVHADLAEAFGTSVLAGEDLAARATAMHARLDAALPIVPQLAEVESGLRAAFDAFSAAGRTAALTTQRIHGDLHLGQVLRTVHRFVVLDFEGEPVAPLQRRRAFDSPLRDVASMLRSFDYAARHQLPDSPGTAQLEYRAEEWAQRNRSAFRAGYAEASGHDLDNDDALIHGFEADKAVYEAVYESRNRPGWLPIPLASLARLGAGDAA